MSSMSSSSPTITRNEHDQTIADLKKRYKKEALKACEKKYQEGLKAGAEKYIERSSTIEGQSPAKNKAHEQAALVSKITSKFSFDLY